MQRLLAAFILLLPACFTYQPPPLELTAMPAWLIPYWIADVLVTLGLVVMGLGSAGIALIWLRTRLGGGRRLLLIGLGRRASPSSGTAHGSAVGGGDGEVVAIVGPVMSETFCPRCGSRHDPNTGSCPELPLAGRTVPDGLRVLERLSETSLGVHYRAQCLDSHDEVELVILRPRGAGSEPTAEASGLVHLLDELHRATRIKHPNLANVRAMGETEEGAQWVIFEAFRGELLSEMLRARDLLPPNEAIDLILQAASGLQAAHEVGLVHGNLSPDTIVVTRTAGNRPLVKLIGFGQVQHGAEPSAESGESGRHAAPERLAGHPPDERSDVFSLGAVLQHLLTGAPPGAERDEALPIPEAARRVLAKALEPPPDDRFQRVAAFARALATATSRPPARIRSGARRAGRRGQLGTPQRPLPR
jgi:hypothetical protein